MPQRWNPADLAYGLRPISLIFDILTFRLMVFHDANTECKRSSRVDLWWVYHRTLIVHMIRTQCLNIQSQHRGR